MTIARRPLGEHVPLREFFDRLFDESFFRPLRLAGNGGPEILPSVDLISTPEEVVLKVALAGIKPDDVDISVTEESVTISGRHHEEIEREEAGYHLHELAQGAFTRTIPLPMPVKSAEGKATFREGLLTLTLPKAQAVKSYHVPIRAG